MRRPTRARAAALLLCAGLVAATPAYAAAPSRPDLVSGGVAGQPANGSSEGPALSADGNLVAFSSSADDLVPGDTNGVRDVFVRDLATGDVERVSVSSAGQQADRYAFAAQVSADGRYVGFVSSATTLVDDELPPGDHFFLHDRSADVTRAVQIPHGDRTAHLQPLWASLSGNGRFLAFVSGDALDPGDADGGVGDIYRLDLDTMKVRLVTVAPEGRPSRLPFDRPSLSHSGRFVAFETAARLLERDRNGERDVYVRDLREQRTQLVSMSSRGVGGDKGARAPAISAGGRYVVFSSWASTLVAHDTNRKSDVFIRDRRLRRTERVSVSSGERQGNRQTHGESTFIGAATVSADGRFVGFSSLASNFARDDANDALDVFVRDRATGTTRLVSATPDGRPGNGKSSWAAISADGSRIAFGSWATDLVPGDTNGASDVFALRLGG